MVTSTDLGWIQSAFNMLMGIYDWVGLKTNIRKRVGVVCGSLQASNVQADEAYT